MASEGQPDHGGAHLVAAALSLSNILLGFDDAALNIATYLSANDNIALQSVNRGWVTSSQSMKTPCLKNA